MASLLSALCSTLALANTARAEAGVAPATNLASEQAAPGYFSLASSAVVADVFVDSGDWQVAQIAARDLSADVERVTGRKPALKQTTEALSENTVLVGTLGKSPVIDRLVKEGRIEVKDVQGQWESFVIATVTDPLPGVRRALVIIGSDRRGTAYDRNTTPFNCYPQNKVVADNYAIVMGSSHIEPMLRNNMAKAEWDREGGGEWDYQKNPAPIREYWARRLVENGRYENIYTLGMRGKDDEPMKFSGPMKEKISLMEQIFADQRALLAQHVNPESAKVPQVFIPYTEVLGLYDSGLKVPGDVTICWPDDNFGYIRRLPTAAEQMRSAGSGIYYHIQWSATPSQPWVQLNQTSGTFATEQRLWVSIDWNRAPTGEAPRILTGKGGDVLANLRRLTTTVKITSPGQHTLTVWMVDPGVVLDKLVLDFTPAKDTYLGPPESFRR